jgi:hypothetical protein
MRSALIPAALALAWAAPLWAAQDDGGKAPARDLTPAEAARKVLNEKITLDYVGQSFEDVVNHLREKTKVNFVLDNFAAQGRVILPPGFNPGGNPPAYHLKVTGKLRRGLQSFLDQYHLTCVILADSVLITTEGTASQRQLRQRVSVDPQGKPLQDVLRQLSRETGVNLVIDPTVADKLKQKATLQLEDATVETAVRLLAEVGGLKSVQVGELLFITTEERAGKIRKENDADSRHAPAGPPSPFPVPWGGRAGLGAVAPALPPVVPPARNSRPLPQVP